jgi:hypothetical protein
MAHIVHVLAHPEKIVPQRQNQERAHAATCCCPPWFKVGSELAEWRTGLPASGKADGFRLFEAKNEVAPLPAGRSAQFWTRPAWMWFG